MADCIFCRIVAGEVPAERVAEGAEWLAFRDTDGKAPTHILVIPTRHIASLTELSAGDEAVMGAIIVAIAAVAEQEGLAGGYRVVVNAGRDAGQSVDHIHFHLLGGRRLGWPPG
jgi:histidine triad (HIT) family protein